MKIKNINLNKKYEIKNKEYEVVIKSAQSHILLNSVKKSNLNNEKEESTLENLINNNKNLIYSNKNLSTKFNIERNENDKEKINIDLNKIKRINTELELNLNDLIYENNILDEKIRDEKLIYNNNIKIYNTINEELLNLENDQSNFYRKIVDAININYLNIISLNDNSYKEFIEFMINKNMINDLLYKLFAVFLNINCHGMNEDILINSFIKFINNIDELKNLLIEKSFINYFENLKGNLLKFKENEYEYINSLLKLDFSFILNDTTRKIFEIIKMSIEYFEIILNFENKDIIINKKISERDIIFLNLKSLESIILSLENNRRSIKKSINLIKQHQNEMKNYNFSGDSSETFQVLGKISENIIKIKNEKNKIKSKKNLNVYNLTLKSEFSDDYDYNKIIKNGKKSNVSSFVKSSNKHIIKLKENDILIENNINSENTSLPYLNFQKNQNLEKSNNEYNKKDSVTINNSLYTSKNNLISIELNTKGNDINELKNDNYYIKNKFSETKNMNLMISPLSNIPISYGRRIESNELNEKNKEIFDRKRKMDDYKILKYDKNDGNPSGCCMSCV